MFLRPSLSREAFLELYRDCVRSSLDDVYNVAIRVVGDDAHARVVLSDVYRGFLVDRISDESPRTPPYLKRLAFQWARLLFVVMRPGGAREDYVLRRDYLERAGHVAHEHFREVWKAVVSVCGRCPEAGLRYFACLSAGEIAEVFRHPESEVRREISDSLRAAGKRVSRLAAPTLSSLFTGVRDPAWPRVPVPEDVREGLLELGDLIWRRPADSGLLWPEFVSPEILAERA